MEKQMEIEEEKSETVFRTLHNLPEKIVHCGDFLPTYNIPDIYHSTTDLYYKLCELLEENKHRDHSPKRKKPHTNYH